MPERDVTVPVGLAAEIDRALRVEPGDRHREATELRSALAGSLG